MIALVLERFGAWMLWNLRAWGLWCLRVSELVTFGTSRLMSFIAWELINKCINELKYVLHRYAPPFLNSYQKTKYKNLKCFKILQRKCLSSFQVKMCTSLLSLFLKWYSHIKVTNFETIFLWSILFKKEEKTELFLNWAVLHFEKQDQDVLNELNLLNHRNPFWTFIVMTTWF